ncbi:hypothetical protein ACM66B_000694 [Microbotryomycetes sp. NB124-2]
MLDDLPAKQLVILRSVSPCFATIIDGILRCRMMAIINSNRHEIVFDSTMPFETRMGQRHALDFSHFEESKYTGAGEAAHFTLPVLQSHFLPLDEGESFGTTLLSLHVREKPPQLSTPPTSPPSSRSATPRQSSLPTSGWAGPSTPLERFTTRTVVGSGPARLFRHWFEDRRRHPLASPLEPRTLEPSGATALISAQLLCHQVTPTTPLQQTPSYPFSTFATSSARLFEYQIERIKVDIGKFCAALEDAGSQRKFMIRWAD